jgi:hypothetical protein
MNIATVVDWLMGVLSIIGWTLLGILVFLFLAALLGIFLLRRWFFSLRERYVGQEGIVGQVVIPILGALLWLIGYGMKNTPKKPSSTSLPPEKRISNVERTIHDV